MSTNAPINLCQDVVRLADSFPKLLPKLSYAASCLSVDLLEASFCTFSYKDNPFFNSNAAVANVVPAPDAAIAPCSSTNCLINRSDAAANPGKASETLI